MSGLNISGFEEYFRIAILILASIITVLSALKTFYKSKDKWIRYTSTSGELKKIKLDFEFYVCGKEFKDISINELEKFKNVLNSILANTNEKWVLISNKKK